MRFLAVLLAIAALLTVVILLYQDLVPPKRVTFAAGVADGGYRAVAEQYREVLARDGISVEILETGGSVDNLALMSDGQAEVGLIQGGVPTAGSGVEALAVVFAEPILAFARRDRPVRSNLAEWTGLRIARGGAGSGARVAIDQLLEKLEIGAPRNALVDIGGRDAADALLRGQIDVALFVAPIEAGYLDALFKAPDVQLLDLEHARAISLRMAHSWVVTVPEGAVDLDPLVPEEPLRLVTLRARLAAVPDLHPALIDRLVMAAREIHGGHSALAQEGEFPTSDGADMPMEPGALKLLDEGPSGFHDWLPYWVAAQIGRVLLVLLPLLLLLFPLFRLLPAVYGWTMRRRVWRHYRQIRRIEQLIEEAGSAETLQELDAELKQIDANLAQMPLPPAFRERAFDARLHIDLVRRRIVQRLAEGSVAEPAA